MGGIMEHLEFVDKLDKFGCSFRSTNIENAVKEIEVHNLSRQSKIVEVKNFKCGYKDISVSPTPLQAIIMKAFNVDHWMDDRNEDMDAKSYREFKEAIQEKILKKAEEVDFLMTVYFQLQYEISNLTQSEEADL